GGLRQHRHQGLGDPVPRDWSVTMAATYQAAGQGEWEPAVASFSFTPDGGTLEGDVFVVAVVARDDATLTLPAGAEVAFQHVNISSDRHMTVFAWAAPSDAPGAVSIPLSASTRGSLTWTRWRGVDAVDAINAVAQQYVYGASADAPSVA